MDPALRIIPISDVDLDQIAALVNRAFGTYTGISAVPRTTPSQYAEEAGFGARVIVAEADGLLVASAMIAPAERFIESGVNCSAGTEASGGHAGEVASHPWAGTLYFGIAAVEPELMNRGLGRRLVGLAEQVAVDERFRGIGLGTLREFGLVPYYQTLGYSLVSEESYPAGHWDFLVPHNYCEMVKAL